MIGTTHPSPDELEVSLFGPGYGEAVVVHLGDGRWLIVDSCIDPETGVVPSLEYLKDIGVDLNECVEWIVATHWHDDHIRGLARCVERCGSARFGFSHGFNHSEFFTLLYDATERSLLRSSGVSEFYNVMGVLDRRGEAGVPARYSKPTPLKEDTRFRGPATGGGVRSEAWALSPSTPLVVRTLSSVGDWLGLGGGIGQPRTRVTEPGANEASVVVWVDVGGTQVLLGGDLEVQSAASGEGWLAILNSSDRPEGSAEVFKVAHHGSVNGDHVRIWEELLSPDPVAIVAPFSNGRVVLPRESDIERICARAGGGSYLAGPRGSGQKVKRSRPVERTVREVSKSGVRRLQGRPGQVRLRKGLSEGQEDIWSVELGHPAADMCT